MMLVIQWKQKLWEREENKNNVITNGENDTHIIKTGNNHRDSYDNNIELQLII